MWSRKSRVKIAPQAAIRIVMPREAMMTVFDECDAFPDDETGGRIIGTYREAKGVLTITVAGIIEPGPRARRSRVSLFQDGSYQERVFRRVEQAHPEIEHLGSWHTHHVNGLPHLSGGDIETYTRTVNHENHNTSFFYALLVTGKNPGAKGIDRYEFRHYVFHRGGGDFVEVPASDVKFTDTAMLWPVAAAPAGPATGDSGPREEWPGRVADRDTLGELYKSFRSYTSQQLGFYWRGKLELVDGSEQDLLVLEDQTGREPAYTVMLRNPPEPLHAAGHAIAKPQHNSARQALADTERTLNRALFEQLRKTVR